MKCCIGIMDLMIDAGPNWSTGSPSANRDV